MSTPDVRRVNTQYPRNTRCQAQIKDSTKRFRDFLKQDYYCMLAAAYSVDGILLCKRHAGEELIRLLVKEKEE